MSEGKPRIGFAGLGIMGRGMARNYLTKGWPLTVWNRTPRAAEPLAAEGAEVAATPRALAESCDVIVTCLSTPAALLAVANGPDGILAGVRRGQRWIDTSTVGVPTSQALGRACEAAGVEYLEAPVTGS
jgi:3-hydroxyisobutyrate dehydrogenase-like beta-hydroxyacid dehydrogenase